MKFAPLSMFRYFIIILIPIMAFKTIEKPSFKEKQLDFNRVFEAFRDNWNQANGKLKTVGVNPYKYDVFIRAFKFEEDLEVWAKNRDENEYHLVTTYKFCNNVGELGPKRKEGDKQIPEGIYTLSKFNPTSEYFLSLKVSYPNKSDSILGDPYQPGGMIFIHGGCQTIGCIPITDEWIKELYVFCVQAKHTGQQEIPIHIFPARMSEKNLSLIKKQHSDFKLHRFWEDLKEGYDLFEHNRRIPRTVISPRGEYFFFEN